MKTYYNPKEEENSLPKLIRFGQKMPHFHLFPSGEFVAQDARRLRERLAGTGGHLTPSKGEGGILNRAEKKGRGDKPFMVQGESRSLLIRGCGFKDRNRNPMDRKVFRHDRHVMGK